MKWIVSTEENRWESCNDFSSQKGDEIVINQPIGRPLYGFGSCISELGAGPLLDLPPEERERAFEALFGESGCKFSFCRLSVGANDFADGWYSCDEEDGDYNLEKFSIDRDKKKIIPAIKIAMQKSKNLKFFASPWSPPTWVKFPKVYNFGKFVATDENCEFYAKYFRKFVEEYKKEGITVSQIHFQNELFADQKFPSCVWEGEDVVKFLRDYLIDELDGVAEVWYGTINGPENYGGNFLNHRHNNYLNLAMQYDKCRKGIKGASFQWAGKFGIMQAQEDYPDLNFIHSECECGDGTNTWQYAMYTFEMLRHYFKFGARACVYWNTALDYTASSSWGWEQNSLITVKDGKCIFNPDFYAVKHFAHFVEEGAVMLKTESRFNTNTAVFKNPNGIRVAIIMNPFNFEKTVSIEGVNYKLKPRSFNSILLD